MVWKPLKSLSWKQSDNTPKRLVPLYLVKHRRDAWLDFFAGPDDGQHWHNRGDVIPIYGRLSGLAWAVLAGDTLVRKRASIACYGCVVAYKRRMSIFHFRNPFANLARRFPDALALEFSSLDVGTKFKFLSGWICWSRIGESHANCPCGARYGNDDCRYVGLCGGIFYHFRFGVSGVR